MAKVEWRNRIIESGTAAPETLVPNPENYRIHGEQQQKAMAGALAEVGWVQPVTVNRTTGRLVDGHMRVALAIRRGEPAIPVNYVELTQAEERIALATIDPLGDLATQGDEELRALLDSVAVKDQDLADLLASMAHDAGGDTESGETTRETETAADRVEALRKKWAVEPGDIFQVGPHRIGCLDATKPESLARLFAGKKAHLVFTDPPYGVAYDGDNVAQKRTAGHRDIAQDDLTGDALIDFITVAVRNAVDYSYDDAAYYIWHAGTARREFEVALARTGLIERQYLLWVKPWATLGRSDYQQQHEPCFYATKDGVTPRWFGDRDKTTAWIVGTSTTERASAAISAGLVVSAGGKKLWITNRPPKGKKLRTVELDADQRLELNDATASSTIWSVERDTTKPYHPTQKPVELPLRALRNSSQPEEIVLDLFLGSGSTAVAAHKAGRVCYGTELDPGYTAVVLERLADEGLKPEKVEP
jgi:DNA modification methylase